jgi:hypothetical protein
MLSCSESTEKLIMKAVLVILLVATAPVVVLMALLRQFLFFAVVAPKVRDKGLRFWINTVGGGTQNKNIKLYLEALPESQRSRWPNWYLAKANLLMLAVVAVWCALLLFAGKT